MIQRGDGSAGAEFSEDMRYRYSLWRDWNAYSEEGEKLDPVLAVVMLNPSTADHQQLDPTIRRCVLFAKRERYGALYVVNLFALRSTDPTALQQADDPVGPENDEALEGIAAYQPPVLLAWGAPPFARDRAENVIGLLRREGVTDLLCLGRTKDGHPKHPLYLRSDTPFEGFTP